MSVAKVIARARADADFKARLLRDPRTTLAEQGVEVPDEIEELSVEELLRESEERYRELFDESPVAIWEEDWSKIKQMIDELAQTGVTNWREHFDSHRDQVKRAYDLAEFTEISRAAVELYRAPSKFELAQMTMSDVVIAEELDSFLEILLSFLAGQMAVDIESRDMAVDGTEITVRRRIVIPPRHRVRWTRVIYAIEDITERQQIEEQLRQAQKMEAIGRLTGGVAHDFNNLLAIIQGNCELLKHRLGGIDDELDAMIRATKRGAELTGHLLAFSRQQPLRPQIVDLDEMISRMSEMLTRTFGETIVIVTKSDGQDVNAFVDAGQVESALLNLALNARDAMDHGGCLTIACRLVDNGEAEDFQAPDALPQDFVLISVSDDGSGMPSEVLARAIEPFYTTKDVGEGSGLGLSMVYGFAQQSGGHVNIDSELGRGTTVKLYLPRALEAPPRAEMRQGEIPRGVGEVILVIEDDLDLKDLLANQLQNLNYRVIGASNAAEARAALTQEPRVDLVLSDVVLPGGANGPKFAEEALGLHRDLKVIFMSGYPAESAKRAGELVSGGILLNKPFEMENLAKVLRQALTS